MELLNFADFAHRRQSRQSSVIGSAAAASAVVPFAAEPTPVTDRWAMLHTERDEPAAVPPDFWADLQLRIAYPSLHVRHH